MYSTPNMVLHTLLRSYIRGIALQKGIVPSLLRETSYSSIRLSLYEPIRDHIMTDEEKKHGAPLLKKFLAGATSGAIGSGLANPADLVKVSTVPG